MDKVGQFLGGVSQSACDIRENIAIATAFSEQHSDKFTCYLPKAGSIAFPE